MTLTGSDSFPIPYGDISYFKASSFLVLVQHFCCGSVVEDEGVWKRWGFAELGGKEGMGQLMVAVMRSRLGQEKDGGFEES